MSPSSSARMIMEYGGHRQNQMRPLSLSHCSSICTFGQHAPGRAKREKLPARSHSQRFCKQSDPSIMLDSSIDDRLQVGSRKQRPVHTRGIPKQGVAGVTTVLGDRPHPVDFVAKAPIDRFLVSFLLYKQEKHDKHLLVVLTYIGSFT